jgi:phage host-nuclease inhibitor protein Gam
MTKTEKMRAAAMGRAEVELLVRELCFASVAIDESTAKMNEELAQVRSRYEPELAAQRATYEGLFAMAEEWAAAHPQEFASRKSIAMVHGTVGYRTGQPTLSPIRGMTWQKVLGVLKSLQPAFVRVKEEIDKQGLTAAAADLGEENLKTIGLRLTQAERFYVDVHKEAATAPEAPPAA